jgi:hypothetical protein
MTEPVEVQDLLRQIERAREKAKIVMNILAVWGTWLVLTAREVDRKMAEEAKEKLDNARVLLEDIILWEVE